MRVIAVIGDSHTWGEGATGYKNVFSDISLQEAGCLWFLPFYIPSFVNLLRNKINESTDSFAEEDTEIHKLPYAFKTSAGLVRLQLFANDDGQKADVYINDKLYNSYTVSRNTVPREFVTVTIRNSEPAKIRIVGNAFIYRIEEYFGEYAIVNCGVGSCPTFRYTDEQWNRLVEPLNASIFLIEPCTINDWLASTTTDEYYANTLRLLDMAKNSGITLMMTVSPILGEQVNMSSDAKCNYSEYIEKSVEAARDLDIPVIDTNRAISEKISGMSDVESLKYMFTDIWHPNGLGHRIYAETVFLEIKKILSDETS